MLSVKHQRDCLASASRPPSMSSWPSLLPELLQHTTTYLLCPSATALIVNIQLLCRLASVCVEWRSLVYHDSSSTYVEFWSCIGAVSVVRNPRVEQAFRVASRLCSVPALPDTLSSLRLIRDLSLHFGGGLSCNAAAPILQALQHYSRLTSLDICLASLVSSSRAVEAVDALTAALAAIGNDGHNRLLSLSLHCSYSIRPKASALRRLCSTVLHLSLSANALPLMAWGTDRLGQRVWKTHSVQSFVLPTANYLTQELVVAALSAALPSCTHLHIEHREEASTVSELLQRMGSRLAFLRGSTTSLYQLPSAVVACTALVSLYVSDHEACGLSAEQVGGIFRCLADCPTLTELSVVTRQKDCWPNDKVHFAYMPQLRFLHLRMHHRVLECTQSPQLYPLLFPSIAHLALVLDPQQPVSLVRCIDKQRLPQLSHCHLHSIEPASDTAEGREAREQLRARLGAAWCESEDNVVRWRVDRVWRRSVGLSDEAEDYSQLASERQHCCGV